MRSSWKETVYRDGEIVEGHYELESKKEYGQEKESVNLYPDIRYQTWEGFGGSLTEAPAYLFSLMSEERKEELLDAYYGEEGLGYTFGRLSLDSCDAALGNYSAMEKETTPDDLSLEGFSIERDEKYIIPFCRRIIEKTNGKLSLMLSPWSPPPFMKTNGEKNHGGSLKPEYRKMWAAYFCRYLKEYEKLGIKIRSISVQNEPVAVQTWDSCIYSAEQEKEFIRDYLYPALKEAGLSDIEIYLWDHNKERVFERTEAIMDDETAGMVSGVAFHWYSGDHFESLGLIREKYPKLKLRFSEGCVEYSIYAADNELANARMFGHDIAGDMNGGASSFIGWSIVFDQDGGPNHVNNLCDAPILYDTRTDTLHKTLSYYYIGHFSRVIVPGSVRIGMSRYTDEIDVAAFSRPDGRLAVVLMNRTPDAKKAFIRLGGQVTMVKVPGDGIASGIIEA